MPEINESGKRKKKLKRKKAEDWERDEDSDYPVHERYAKEGYWKE